MVWISAEKQSFHMDRCKYRALLAHTTLQVFPQFPLHSSCQCPPPSSPEGLVELYVGAEGMEAAGISCRTVQAAEHQHSGALEAC